MKHPTAHLFREIFAENLTREVNVAVVRVFDVVLRLRYSRLPAEEEHFIVAAKNAEGAILNARKRVPKFEEWDDGGKHYKRKLVEALALRVHLEAETDE